MSEERIVAEPDPYLPPVAPSDNLAVAKGTSPKKTVVIWLLLIVMFVAIYNVMAAHPAHKTAHETAHESTSSWTSLDLTSWIIPLGCIAFIVWIFRQLRVSKGYHAATNAASLAIADGDLDRALRGFKEVVERNRGNQHVHAARVNVAWMLQRLGRFDEEREVLLEVERSPGLVYGSEQRMYAAIYLARHFALRGDVDRAEKWIADAKRRRERNPDCALFVVAQMRVTEALLLARRERPDDALAILEKDWPRLEAGLTASILKHVHVLRAFLLAHTGGVRDDGISAQWLAKARPLRLDEIAYLWKEWPALQQWAATQHLSAELATRSA